MRSEVTWPDYVWLVYLSFFFIEPAMRHASLIEWASTIGCAVVFIALYVIGLHQQGRDLTMTIVAITLMGIGVLPFNFGASSFFIYAAGFAGVLLPQRVAVGGIVTITLIGSIESWMLVHSFYAIWPMTFALIIGAVNMHYGEKHRADARLRLAHDEIEHLAKVAERERIARDLHDLLGHTLSLVILKSELASKLADRDPARARDEIRDVERIARDALAQVRAAVRGYRAGLDAELASARDILAAAGVRATIDVQPIDLSPSLEAVLALAVREAVTNVVRHAHAQSCRITLAPPCILTISDDGIGGNAPCGAGLLGMRERIEALGGTIERSGANGTTITIALPREALEAAS